jgi:hypothetical protein
MPLRTIAYISISTELLDELLKGPDEVRPQWIELRLRMLIVTQK